MIRRKVSTAAAGHPMRCVLEKERLEPLEEEGLQSSWTAYAGMLGWPAGISADHAVGGVQAALPAEDGRSAVGGRPDLGAPPRSLPRSDRAEAGRCIDCCPNQPFWK